MPGDYYVVFSNPPAGYSLTAQNQGADATDSDANPTTGKTGVYTLSSGENELTVDAGLVKGASLGDFVWDDLNGNGQQDTGEPGVANVTVTLYNSANVQVGSPQTTNASGGYLFSGLEPGDYYVVFSNPPAGYSLTAQNQGADATDSDANPTTGKTGVYTLSSGENELTVDAGLVKGAGLGDFVWDDLNGNGQQDTGEPGVANVTVTLYNSANVQVGSPQTTTASGGYLFSGLVPGDYYVVFSNPPAGYSLTAQNQGADATDSDADPTTGKTGVYTLSSGENELTVDAGLVKGASLGDFVWDDLNGNGQQDTGEPGVANVTVTLYNSANVQVGSPQTTNASGGYLFSGLEPGDYSVVFSNPPAGYSLTAQNQGADATDSDANPTTGKTGVYTLSSGENELTVDAGLVKGAWATSSGMTSTATASRIRASRAWRTSLSRSTTAPTCRWAARRRPTPAAATCSAGWAGRLLCRLQQSAGGLQLDRAGLRRRRHRQRRQPDHRRDRRLRYSSGENELTVDAGLVKGASLGDFVWDDLNGNGQQDTGEPGVANVTVTLYNSANVQVGSPQTTTASGGYLFSGLEPGDYYVVFSNPPAGYSFTAPNQGADATDSDANPTTGKTGVYALSSGENELTVDAGLVKGASLGDFVWDDLNGNGQQDTGEPGVANVTVTLYDSANVQVGSPQTTNASGGYLFSGLEPGDYYVVFSNPPAGYSLTAQNQGADATDSDANPTTGKTGVYTLSSGENELTVDAGLVKGASLGDFVWDDLNGNGQQDTGEPGVANVTVTLYDSANVQVGSPQTTNASGGYLFSGLEPGDYYVVFSNPPAGYSLTAAGSGRRRHRQRRQPDHRQDRRLHPQLRRERADGRCRPRQGRQPGRLRLG